MLAEPTSFIIQTEEAMTMVSGLPIDKRCPARPGGARYERLIR